MRSHEEQHCAGIPGAAGAARERAVREKAFSPLWWVSREGDRIQAAVSWRQPQPPAHWAGLWLCSSAPEAQPGASACGGAWLEPGPWSAYCDTQRGRACLIQGNTANFQILPCRVVRGISTNRGWGKPGFLGCSPGGEDVTQHKGVAGPSARPSLRCMC